MSPLDISASSAKKRKRANAGGDEEGGVLPTSKVPKVENVLNEDQRCWLGIHKNEVTRAKHMERLLRVATPEKVEKWHEKIAQRRICLERLRSKAAKVDEVPQHLRREELRSLYEIAFNEELVRKYQKVQGAATELRTDRAAEDNPVAADDESSSTSESESDSSNGSNDDESDDEPEFKIHQQSESPTLPQPLIQKAQQPPALASGRGAVRTGLRPNPQPVGTFHIPVRALGAVIGPNLQRLQQVERETGTSITFVDLGDGNSPHECRIQGKDEDIAKATAIFDRLLNFERAHEEELRLDIAVKEYHLLYPLGGSIQASRTQPQAQSQKSSSLAKVTQRVHPADSVSVRSRAKPLFAQKPLQFPRTGPDHDLTRSRASVLGPIPSRKRLDEISGSDSDSPGSSEEGSDEEQPASSPILPPALTKCRPLSTGSKTAKDGSEEYRQAKNKRLGMAASVPTGASLAHRPRTSPLRSPAERSPSPPPARASTQFQVPAGSAVVKIEDDSDEEQKPPPRPQTPPALRRAYDLGIVPIDNMVTLAEFEDILSMKETEKGKLEYKIKVLEYALHFKGVSDPQIMRLMSRSGTVDGKKSWDPKFEGVLGHARQGRVTDGQPLQRQNR